MWPLLKRDGLGVQYCVTLILWNRLLGFNPFRLRPKTIIQTISIVCLFYFELLSLDLCSIGSVRCRDDFTYP